jgi:hypothetical protein
MRQIDPAVKAHATNDPAGIAGLMDALHPA